MAAGLYLFLGDTYDQSATLEFALPDCVASGRNGIENLTYRNDSSTESENTSWIRMIVTQLNLNFIFFSIISLCYLTYFYKSPNMSATPFKISLKGLHSYQENFYFDY